MKAQRLRKTAKLLRRRNCWVMLVTVADHRNNSISHFIGLLREIPSTMDQWSEQFTLHIHRNSGLLEPQSGLQDPSVVIRVETGIGTLTCWFWGLNQQGCWFKPQSVHHAAGIVLFPHLHFHEPELVTCLLMSLFCGMHATPVLLPPFATRSTIEQGSPPCLLPCSDYGSISCACIEFSAVAWRQIEPRRKPSC